MSEKLGAQELGGFDGVISDIVGIEEIPKYTGTSKYEKEERERRVRGNDWLKQQVGEIRQKIFEAKKARPKALDAGNPLYVACVGYRVGEVLTGLASTYKSGEPKCKVFLSDNIAHILSVSIPDRGHAKWFIVKTELEEITKENLCRRWIFNPSNRQHVLDVLLFDLLMERPAHYTKGR